MAFKEWVVVDVSCKCGDVSCRAVSVVIIISIEASSRPCSLVSKTDPGFDKFFKDLTQYLARSSA